MDSPASSTSDLENVWSPKHPLVTAFDIRRLLAPNDAGAPALTTTA
ncbi:MAG: hypothetical protein U0470_10575 [Anaerolineae bacterium]